MERERRELEEGCGQRGKGVESNSIICEVINVCVCL